MFERCHGRQKFSVLLLLRCHLACVESSQKMNVRREHPSGEGFLGYDSLVPEDKARVSEVFGWAKASVDGLQPNSAPTKISPYV